MTGKNLVDRPRVGQRLKDRQIAEVGVAELDLDLLQLLGEGIDLPRKFEDLSAG